MVTLQGTATIRNTQGNADGSTTLTSASSVQVNDIGIHFATVRGGNITSVTPGTVQQTNIFSDIKAATYTSVVGSAGAQSVVYTVSGDYYICSVFVDNVAGAYTITGETETISSGAPTISGQVGDRYFDTNTSPFTSYIYYNGTWNRFN